MALARCSSPSPIETKPSYPSWLNTKVFGNIQICPVFVFCTLGVPQHRWRTDLFKGLTHHVGRDCRIPHGRFQPIVELAHLTSLLRGRMEISDRVRPLVELDWGCPLLVGIHHVWRNISPVPLQGRHLKLRLPQRLGRICMRCVVGYRMIETSSRSSTSGFGSRLSCTLVVQRQPDLAVWFPA